MTSSTVVHSDDQIRSVAESAPTPIGESEFREFWSSWWWVFVKGYHVLEFALLTWLLLRATRGRVMLSCAASVVYAATDEFHQTFVPQRGGLASDVAIDAMGVLAAMLVWTILQKSHNRRSCSTGDEIARTDDA